jgi:RNA polymerase sigma-70 factor, ECF subfamily
MSKESEQTLIDRARDGDRDAFWELVEDAAPMTLRLLTRLTHNKEQAEDLLSQTALKAVDGFEKFRGESKFSTWMVSIALNLARNEMRQSKSRREINWDDVIPAEAHNHGPESAELIEWRDPHEVLAQKELRALLDSALAELPLKYRTVFLLRDAEGLSTKETAKALGLSETAVKSRAVRARLALRKSLAPHFGQKEAKAHGS